MGAWASGVTEKGVVAVRSALFVAVTVSDPDAVAPAAAV